ncbi:MAG TPA: hypothetical protein VM077_00215 [Candidatus Limnocylindrales bacterium]|nr:hypothetical protein [Candidatus Limnocylindrales bacterium]
MNYISMSDGGMPTHVGLIRDSISLVVVVSIILPLIFIVVAGIQWFLAGGDKSKLHVAKRKLKWSIIGFALAFTVYFIISLIGYYNNVELIRFPNIN